MLVEPMLLTAYLNSN